MLSESAGKEIGMEAAETVENANESNAGQTDALTATEEQHEVILSVKKGKQLLRKLEGCIAQGIREFWVVGESLWQIRKQGLYKRRYSGENYESFTDYISDRWGYSRAYQLMSAARVRRLMFDLGVKNPDSVCESERRYREHAALLKLPQDKLDALKSAIKGRKNLSCESFGAELRKLLPAPKEKVEKPTAGEKKLERKLAKLGKEISTLKAEFPVQAERIDSWLKGLLAV